jgi:quinoprotein glucose dehydrogenase
MADTVQSRRRPAWAAVVLGILVFLIGLVLAAGGAWLVALGGSPYYGE